MDELRESIFLDDDAMEEARHEDRDFEEDADAVGSKPAGTSRGATSRGASRGNVSRRTFIQGSVATGAAVSLAGGNLLQPGALQAATEPVSGTLQLRVNGADHEIEIEPMDTLAMVLRYKLDLTGTKLGCDRAECGACTVLVDGVAHYGCSMLAHQVRGREVTTIEGLEQDGVLHPVQQAVIDEMGFQCAFCAPGFIMSMASLVKANPNATRAEAREWLAGHICRCGDYNKILNTAERALENARAALS